MKIYVGNLPENFDEAKFVNLVAAFGKADVTLVKDESGAPQGFGFADFASADHAQAAIDSLNQREVNGNVLVVNKALPPRDVRFSAAGIRGSRRQ